MSKAASPVAITATTTTGDTGTGTADKKLTSSKIPPFQANKLTGRYGQHGKYREGHPQNADVLEICNWLTYVL